ncbi:MAG: hypothetical protein M0038_08510 [Pseudomonadota bacterium]|nr:hypothetical protein [Pseudomonadota bacterium]
MQHRPNRVPQVGSADRIPLPNSVDPHVQLQLNPVRPGAFLADEMTALSFDSGI